MLLFKQRFLDAIRSGEKTQTVRVARFCRFRTGQRSYIPGVGYIRIEQIDEVSLPDLTRHDARLDGFPTLAAMLAELQTLYGPRLAAGERVFRVRFSVLSDQAAEAAKRNKRKTSSRAKKGPTSNRPAAQRRTRQQQKQAPFTWRRSRGRAARALAAPRSCRPCRSRPASTA